ncbi:UDP-N-acetylglucosamine 2-epimerase [Planctomycetaceae bacterium SH139]
MTSITAVTTSRADYGIYLPILKRISRDSDLELDLMVTGSHLAPAFGYTVQLIEEDGFSIRDRIECLMSNDSPVAIAKAMALTILGFSQAFARKQPELLLVLGDRYEMFAAASAAVPFRIPIVHVHGGETTEGAFDEAFRHSLTKMSHLHFAATEAYRDRILQMGEAPSRVFVSGAPSLDNLRDLKFWSQAKLQQHLGLNWSEPPLVVTFHPVTLEFEQTADHVNQLLSALREFAPLPIVFTYPNADTNGQVVIRAIKDFVASYPQAVAGANLGTDGYFSLMREARAMVGNSSSGIIEAASFQLPVVNIGRRQQGRVQGENIINCEAQQRAISAAIERAISSDFRKQLQNLKNPYGSGDAADMIVRELKQLEISEQLFRKHFHRFPSC